MKAGIENVKQLKEALIDKIKNLDMNRTAEDVQPFLINSNDKKRILEFRKFIKTIK